MRKGLSNKRSPVAEPEAGGYSITCKVGSRHTGAKPTLSSLARSRPDCAKYLPSSIPDSKCYPVGRAEWVVRAHDLVFALVDAPVPIGEQPYRQVFSDFSGMNVNARVCLIGLATTAGRSDSRMEYTTGDLISVKPRTKGSTPYNNDNNETVSEGDGIYWAMPKGASIEDGVTRAVLYPDSSPRHANLADCLLAASKRMITLTREHEEGKSLRELFRTELRAIFAGDGSGASNALAGFSWLYKKVMSEELSGVSVGLIIKKFIGDVHYVSEQFLSDKMPGGPNFERASNLLEIFHFVASALLQSACEGAKLKVAQKTLQASYQEWFRTYIETAENYKQRHYVGRALNSVEPGGILDVWIGN